MNKAIFRTLILILFLVLIVSRNTITAQETAHIQSEENWVLEDGLYYEPRIEFRYENYSKADTVRFREKLKLIKSLKTKNEWEGHYTVGLSDVSVPQFIWNIDAGFAEYYIDTCHPSLESVSYGNVLNTPEYIQLLPEKTADSPRRLVTSRYIKIRWGKSFYLVAEPALRSFAEKAVGIYVEDENSTEKDDERWYNFMFNGDGGNPPAGLPEFPAGYKKFQRLPIEAKIIEVGKKTGEDGKDLGEYIRGGETVLYTVVIDAGKNKSVKVDMKFDISETKEEVVITEVGQKTSVGVITRTVDENKNDLCYDDKYESVSCSPIRAALNVKTQVGRFLY